MDVYVLYARDPHGAWIVDVYGSYVWAREAELKLKKTAKEETYHISCKKLKDGALGGLNGTCNLYRKCFDRYGSSPL